MSEKRLIREIKLAITHEIKIRAALEDKEGETC